MIIYAVYIITTDGRTLLAETFHENIPNDILLGGLLTALQNMATEITKSKSEMKTIEIEGLCYHIRSFGLIRIVLVTNLPRSPEDFLQKLGLRFIKQYGETLIDWDSNLNVFLPFKDTIKEIMKIGTTIDGSKSIIPSKKLSPTEIFSLPHQLQATALAIVSLERGTIQEIANETEEESLQIIKGNLSSLLEKGFIGKTKANEEEIYFCSQ